MTGPNLALVLDDLAGKEGVIGYGALAQALAIPGPGSIAKLTAQLEALMLEDAAKGHPFRAALCRAKTGNGLPAKGFFEAAIRLGRFDGGDEAGFVAAERAALFKRAASR
ncbi:hypothetical protein EOK75_13910 (plasmid) [Pseudorhodobacter turbinis]|uniref:Uncharacterized protein n=1 Tax=Pseudorhodobacter turbinis TaxID=2500533 RepID=A0A4P8EJL3_9RHOB|nr:hypothetical protein [Pseudorhodobacter turbinis]QCO56895.1 hypothetical protein EOK75_13910 [Pseudorhodobacter turbinis]